MEVGNRFKGLDIIDRMPDGLWMEVRDIVQERGIKTIPQKRNAKQQNGSLRRKEKEKKINEKQRRKERIYPFECRVPKNSKER